MSRWTDLSAAEIAALSAKNRASRVHKADANGNIVQKGAGARGPAQEGSASTKPPAAHPTRPDSTNSGIREARPPLQIRLPWPPTVNHYWLPGRDGRRYISGAGQSFRANVKWLGHGFRCMTGHVAITVTAYPPDRKRRDLDNLLKSLLDALQHAGLIEDDSNVTDLRITRAEQVKKGAVDVEIRQAP